MPRAAATTDGLTHIDIAVRDPERSLAFYGAVFGMTVWRRKDDGIVATTPGARDLSTGRPYAKLKDLDGYEVEVYEMVAPAAG